MSEEKGMEFGISERSGISDRFLDNYVNADVLAGRSAANNVITESHYCTHEGDVRAAAAVAVAAVAVAGRIILSLVLSCFSSLRVIASSSCQWIIKGCKSALISGSFNLDFRCGAQLSSLCVAFK